MSDRLANDFMVPPRSRTVRSTVNELLNELAPRALALVDAFGIPAPCLGPLADPEYLTASGLAHDSA